MITDEQWKEVLENISSGLSNKDAYTLAGISKGAFYEEKKNNLDFLDSLKKAELKFKQSLVDKIATDRQWQASAWLLERKFKKEFGKVDRLDMTTKGKEIKQLTVEVLNTAVPLSSNESDVNV